MTAIKLSAEARKIVESRAAFIEVPARPGSGKTTVCVAVIESIVRHGHDARDQLVLSFSNQSVNEFRSRIKQTSLTSTATSPAASARAVRIETCHAFALELAQREHARSADPGTGQLRYLEDMEKRKLIRRSINSARKAWTAHCKNAGADPDADAAVTPEHWSSTDMLFAQLATSNGLRQLEQLFGLASALTLSIAETVKRRRLQFLKWTDMAAALRQIQRRYQQRKTDGGVLDYDDMLRLAIRALSRSDFQLPRRFTHLIVDEYQDCTPQQTQFIAALARRIGRALVVGDRFQALYEFLGGTYTPLSRVLPNVVTMPLSTSFRLTRENAMLARSIIETERHPLVPIKTLKLKRGPKPVLVITDSVLSQARAVVRDVRALLAQGVPASQIAVLARLRQTLRVVEQLLRSAGTETDQVGMVRDHRLALTVLKMVRLVERHRNQQQPSPVTVGQLKKLLPAVDCEDAKWKRATSRLMAIKSNSLGGRFKLCRAIYLWLCGGAREHKVQNKDLNRWIAICAKFKSGAREMAAEVRRLGTTAPVTTTTIHSAKGGQWDHVFVIGASEGLLPLKLSHVHTPIAPERRAMFVAVTRAGHQLRLYHAPPPPSAQSETGDFSRFLRRAIDTGRIDVEHRNQARCRR
jgi:DNA helicase-2/ATP-dependent DNA helicase PcrA